MNQVSSGEATLIELIAVGDADAVAGFYDARSPSVREYCAEICPPEQVDDAVLAAFIDFLGRVQAGPPDADPDELLRKSTRTAAASRMHVAEPHEPACRSMPDLIAARANAELLRDDEPMNKHLQGCATCQETADRITQAEDAMIRSPAAHPAERVRAAWLEIGSREDGPAAAHWAAQTEEASEAQETAAAQRVPEADETPEEDEVPPAQEAPEAQEIPPPQPQPIRGRRRGGLVGAARRLVSPPPHHDRSP